MEFPFSDLCDYELAVTLEGRVFLLGMAAVLGGVLGSFMNVVVYRLPRGMSVSRPASRCPSCEHPIRWHDNVPVLGWLMLRGRCRDCGAPISPRYPLVEALVAVTAAALLWTQPTLTGISPGDGEIYYLVDVSRFALELLLACVLYCAALIEYDGLVPPLSLFAWPLVAGLAMVALWPHLLPAPAAWSEFPLPGLLSALAGMAAAMVMGLTAAIAWLARSKRYVLASLLALVVLGAFLGARPLVPIAVASMAIYATTQIAARSWPAVGRFGWAGPLAVVTLIWMTIARSAGWFPLPPFHPSWQLLALGVTFALALITRCFGRNQQR